jgi:hypothetical protein
MKSRTFWLIVAAALLAGYIFYFFKSSRGGLEVSPHAGEEIEKAKRR